MLKLLKQNSNRQESNKIVYLHNSFQTDSETYLHEAFCEKTILRNENDT